MRAGASQIVLDWSVRLALAVCLAAPFVAGAVLAALVRATRGRR